MEVPVEALTPATTELSEEQKTPRRWPRRIRMRPLEFWRNEHVQYERLAGSDAPSIAKVVYNCAPRSQEMGERTMSAKAQLAATPVICEHQQAEFVSIKTASLVSKLVVLPPVTGTTPPTITFPPFTKGHVFVVDGSLRYALDFGDEAIENQDQALLNAGDHLLLAGGEHGVLLASAGARGTSTGAKFKVFLVANRGSGAHADAPPLGQ